MAVEQDATEGAPMQATNAGSNNAIFGNTMQCLRMSYYAIKCNSTSSSLTCALFPLNVVTCSMQPLLHVPGYLAERGLQQDRRGM